MKEGEKMDFGIYDLNSERWRQPIYDGREIGSSYHHHFLDMKEIPSVTTFLSYGSEFDSRVSCVFCLADSTFDRTLEEILYHFDQYRWVSDKITHEVLINKWKKNMDAWGNPIGNNIKG